MEAPAHSVVFTPAKLAGLQLSNRVIRAGCFEGMSQGGAVTGALVDHHRRLARGGVAMTTVAYCAVSHDGRAFDHELWMREDIVPDLRRLTQAVHSEGGAASIQLSHCGFFTNTSVIGEKPMGASPKWCLFMRSRCREMTREDIEDKIGAFTQAAVLARKAGFDAVEIHAGHGYLLSQFLSPWTNRRRDEYGGSLRNRMRFLLQVIKNIKNNSGEDFPVLVKMNQRDGMQGGFGLDEAVEVAVALEQAGASAIIPSAGFTAKDPFLMLRGNLPVAEMSANQPRWFERVGMQLFGRFLVPSHDYAPMFQFEGADRIRRAVSIPVIYIGGVESLEQMEMAVKNGFPFVQVGRATIRDPDFVRKLCSGEIRASDCDHCNRCVAAMDAGGVYCVSAKSGLAQVSGA